MPTPIPVLLTLLNNWQGLVPANLADASSITANRHRQVETSSYTLVEAMIDSYRHVNDLIPISDVINLQTILDSKEDLITPKRTAFNRDFTASPAGGVSVIVPRSDDPRFTDNRTPIDNSVSTIKLQNNSVTNQKLADMPPFTLKGNNTAGTADPIDLTVPQVQALLGILPPYTASQSVLLTGQDFTLVNDSLAPGNNQYYGTNDLGTKGYFSLATIVQDLINTSSITIPGDDWGSQVVAITSLVSTPTYPGPYSILQGTGVLLDPLSLNGLELETLIQDVIDNQPPAVGDNWGTQVVQTAQSSNLSFTYSLLAGDGTVGNPLTIQGAVLQTFINDVINSNPALSINDWGSQVAITSGIITGNGTALNPIRLVQGSNSASQYIKWNHISSSYQLVSAAQINTDILNVSSEAPIIGNGTPISPIRLQDGVNNNDTLVWNQGLSQWEITSAPVAPGTQNLQQVTDIGNVTTNDVYINSLYLYDAADVGYSQIGVSNSRYRLTTVNGGTAYSFDYGGTTNTIEITNSGAYTLSLQTGHTANRSQSFPDASGTIALLQDIQALTSGVIIGNGTTGNEVRLTPGTNNNDTLLWNSGLAQWEVQPAPTQLKYVETIAPLGPSSAATVAHNLGTTDIVVDLTSDNYSVMVSRVDTSTANGLYYEILNANERAIISSDVWGAVLPIKVVIIA